MIHSKTNRPVRLHALAAAAALILTGTLASQNALAANGLAASKTLLRKGDAVTGMLPASHPMHIEVALKLRNRDQLDKFVAAAALKGSPTFGQVMSHDRLAADHLPTVGQAQRVAAYLKQFGFTNVTIAPNRLLVSADGTATNAQEAFLVSLAKVHTRDGRDTFANTGDVHVPASLQDTVLSVIGLQDVYRAHRMVTTQAVTGHNPTEFSSIYGGSGATTGAGVTVGIITQGSLAQTITDLNTFTSNNGLATVTTQTVNTNGTSTDTSGVGEWNLDSQDIVGMAGGQVGKIIFYNIPSLSNTDLTADINTAVNANAAKIINVSLGECETSAQGDGSAASQDQAFQVATSQGQTFSISTGDSGADECANGGTTPSWPAASQYVIAAAGTTLNASTTTWSSETVWSGSGGSQSTFEPKPSWQTLWSGTHRGVADIAFDGDPNSGSKVIVNGSIQQIGGTSLSAPLFAGLWARVIAAKGTGVGFAGPLIYNLPAADFHDITSGNNNGSTAGVGYDLASGRGSLMIAAAINDIGGGGGGGSTVLSNGVPVTGISGAAGSDFRYTLDVPAGATGLNFVTSGGTGDADLYVKFGSDPTTTTYDCKSDGSTTAETCNIATAQVGTYHVLVHAYAAISGVSLTGSYTAGGGGGGSSQLLGNTGFESGTAPWTTTTGVVSNSTSEPPHAGSYDAWMDGYGSAHTDTVSQSVAIPAGKTSATLQYYLHIDTAETTTTSAYDKLTVQVLNSSGTVLKTCSTFSNLNKVTGYAVHTCSLSSYIGQTVTIKFTGTEDSSLQTSFVLDDVTLTVQ